MPHTVREVILSVRARNALDECTSIDRERVRQKLSLLAMAPVPSDAKCIGRDAGELIFRIRVGPYRVIYTFTAKTVSIMKIGRRDHVYDRKP